METKIIAMFAAVGIIVGYISFLINEPLINLTMAIVIGIVGQAFTRKAMKITEEKKWWVNPLFVYFITWFIIWVLFYNLRLFYA